MSKHTPEPWQAHQWHDKEAGISGWSFSAGGHLLPLCDATGDHEEAEANARLIKAAPKMLEALMHVRRCVPYGGFVQIHDGSATLAQIDAAIADATEDQA